jgi:biotin transporter BioY
MHLAFKTKKCLLYEIVSSIKRLHANVSFKFLSNVSANIVQYLMGSVVHHMTSNISNSEQSIAKLTLLIPSQSA